MNLRNSLIRLDSYIEYYASYSIYNNALGLARTLLAAGTALTLLFTDEKVLFKSGLHPGWSSEIVPINALNFFNLVPVNFITLTKWIVFLILIIIASGWRPRFTCIPHWYISTCFLNSALDIEGGDQITSNITMLLLPILLMDSRKWHWQRLSTNGNSFGEKVRGIISNTLFYVIKLQVCVIYFHAAIGKIGVNQWLDGTAPYYWFNHPVFGMSSWLKPLLNPFLTNSYFVFLLSWGVIVWELILAAAIFMEKKHYKRLFIIAVGFHFLIVVVHGLFSFFFAMTGALCLYFLVEYNNRVYEK